MILLIDWETLPFLFIMVLGLLNRKIHGFHRSIAKPRCNALRSFTVKTVQSVVVNGIKSSDIMEAFGEKFATVLNVGDVLLLTGDVGAGKTTISRGIVHGLTEDYYMRVTSPTYLLSNAYMGENGVSVHHFDLYRLSGRKDLSTLNIPNVFPTTISLIEWPDRLGEFKPENHIAVTLSINKDESRSVRIDLQGEKWETNGRRNDFQSLSDISDILENLEE